MGAIEREVELEMEMEMRDDWILRRGAGGLVVEIRIRIRIR